MKAVLTRDYRCAPEGHTTIEYKEGQEVDGIVAQYALADGAARKTRKTTPRPQVTKPAAPDHEA